MKIKLIISAGLLLFAAAHALGMLSLYKNFLWYDNILHVLAGAWIASIIWLIKTREAVFVFGIVALTGVLWEFSEFIFDALLAPALDTAPLQQSLQDTLSDLFMDLLGAAFVITFFYSKRKKGGNN